MSKFYRTEEQLRYERYMRKQRAYEEHVRAEESRRYQERQAAQSLTNVSSGGLVVSGSGGYQAIPYVTTAAATNVAVYPPYPDMQERWKDAAPKTNWQLLVESVDETCRYGLELVR